MPARTRASFIEPMLLLRTEKLPDGPEWLYELKYDGYRAIAFKTAGKVFLRSRNDNDFTARYPTISAALAKLPNDTVVDGEVVALDEAGHPSFNVLQNHGSSGAPLLFYIFDLLILAGKDVRGETLEKRQALLQEKVLDKLQEPIRYAWGLNASLTDLIPFLKKAGAEGLVAKRRDSVYEAGQRSGAWRKMRLNQGQEFVVGGYTVGGKSFDALIFGYYEGEKLIYVARTRNGFTPSSRLELARQLGKLVTKECPFANLPEPRGGRWGAGLTAAKMKDCVWLKPELVGQFEFLEWTPDNHLRHSKFIALRDDKQARNVGREEAFLLTPTPKRL
jgi:DNA ligase D-like protein (predicted ligase)